jgi:TPP-dependent pyruvate/acetoin dehydrogenase alpha subunit
VLSTGAFRIANIGKEPLIQMYRKLLEIRKFVEKVWDLFGHNLVPETLAD